MKAKSFKLMQLLNVKAQIQNDPGAASRGVL